MTSENRPLTLASFFKYCSEGKLMSAKCEKCDSLWIPPREICPTCLSSEMTWKEMSRDGELLTYTVVHVPAPSFKGRAPYVVGIVRLTEGPVLSGLVREAEEQDMIIGKHVTTRFESVQGPKWQPGFSYYFVPV